MIRAPDAEYEFINPSARGDKHTKKLFKFKPFDDCECKVIGKNASGCKGYQCVLPNGVEFGLSSYSGVKCGKNGTIVTITCQVVDYWNNWLRPTLLAELSSQFVYL